MRGRRLDPKIERAHSVLAAGAAFEQATCAAKRSAVSSISCDWRPQGINSIRTNVYIWPRKILAIELGHQLLIGQRDDINATI